MGVKEKIYIKLLDEGIDTWRPTFGEKIEKNIYKILPTKDYNPNEEEWEFIPGTIVKCECQKRDLGRGERIDVLVAVKKVE